MIVYKVINKINNKMYVGKTNGNLFDRKRKHERISLRSKNTYFHNALNKYGFDNFEWSILCETDSESKLNALEKFYIAAYRKIGKLYNMTDGGEGKNGWKPSSETLLKMSQSKIGNKNPFFGKHFNPESIKKLSESRKGKATGKRNGMFGVNRKGEKSPNYNRIFSDEWCKNISLSRIGKKNPAARSVKNIDTNEIFFTIKEAAEWCGLKHSSTILRNISGKLKTAGGYHWEYADRN